MSDTRPTSAEARDLLKGIGDDPQLAAFAHKLIAERDAFTERHRRKPTTVVFRTKS